jgi:hydroxyacylglutathione hydrolase
MQECKNAKGPNSHFDDYVSTVMSLCYKAIGTSTRNIFIYSRNNQIFHMSTHNISNIKTHNAGSSIEIRVIPMFTDNYGYVVIDKASKDAAVVDPADHVNMMEALKSMTDINLKQVWNTHKHDDHAGGNIKFSKSFPGIKIYGPKHENEEVPAITNPCEDGDSFNLGNTLVKILYVPCHTRGHIAFFGEADSNSKVLACGDTLFNGGCGRFFEGTADEMVINLQRFRQLGDNVVCLPAHEYTLGNFAFNASIDENLRTRFDEIKKMRDDGFFTVPTTIQDEKLYNLFMNTDDSRIQSLVANASGDNECIGNEVKTMKYLRELKNNFRG